MDKGDDVWDIGFYYGEEIPELENWKVWDGKDLIGVFPNRPSNKSTSSYANTEMYSTSNATFPDFATVSGSHGKTVLPYRCYNILGLLYIAIYGTTQSLSVSNSDSSVNYSTSATGGSLAKGMVDTARIPMVKYTSNGSMSSTTSDYTSNFFGLEHYAGGYYEVLSGITYDSSNSIIVVTDIDGTTRSYPALTKTGYISTMAMGEYADLIPVNTSSASATTYYCDQWHEPSSSDEILTCGGFQPNGGIFSMGRVPNTSLYQRRTCWRGDFVELSVEEFTT
jgi:hypothetical protein